MGSLLMKGGNMISTSYRRRPWSMRLWQVVVMVGTSGEYIGLPMSKESARKEKEFVEKMVGNDKTVTVKLESA